MFPNDLSGLENLLDDETAEVVNAFFADLEVILRGYAKEKADSLPEQASCYE